MEQELMDRVARGLARGLHRRSLVWLAAAAGLGVASLPGVLQESAAKKKKKKKRKKNKTPAVTCSAPAVACKGQCVTLTSTSNCGGCGVQCSASQTCVNGACQNTSGCGSGTVCGSTCCTSGQVCQGGLFCSSCGGPAEPCCAGQTCDSGLACIFQGTVCGPPI